MPDPRPDIPPDHNDSVLKSSPSSSPNHSNSNSKSNPNSDSKSRIGKTRREINLELQILERLMYQGYTDHEAMHHLNLRYSTYWRYKAKLHKRVAQAESKKAQAALFHEKNVLKARLVRLQRAMEERATDKRTPPSAAAYCAEVAAELGINVFRLEWEGARALTEVNSIAHKAEVLPVTDTTTAATTTTIEYETRTEGTEEDSDKQTD